MPGASTLRPFPARGRFFLSSLTLLTPNSSTRGHTSNVYRSQAGNRNKMKGLGLKAKRETCGQAHTGGGLSCLKQQP